MQLDTVEWEDEEGLSSCPLYVLFSCVQTHAQPRASHSCIAAVAETSYAPRCRYDRYNPREARVEASRVRDPRKGSVANIDLNSSIFFVDARQHTLCTWGRHPSRPTSRSHHLLQRPLCRRSWQRKDPQRVESAKSSTEVALTTSSAPVTESAPRWGSGVRESGHTAILLVLRPSLIRLSHMRGAGDFAVGSTARSAGQVGSCLSYYK